ncbi:MAG: RnfABCDGE type electron transport complex subunit B [Candidatus Pelethousia sp.]|nr:RnfABCDGE type electron transport complex subunit B [Candidatus Pelethousia sp.]
MNWIAIIAALGVMGLLGAVFGVVLSIADKKFAVEMDKRVAAIREAVAGANCGACGFAGCDAFAEAVAKGDAPVDGCTPAGAKGAAAIAEIMGVSAETAGEKKVARVFCRGVCEAAKERYTYDGLESCAMAATMAGGPKQCISACLGLGDCLRVCPFDAIEMENGIAKIRADKCVACGKCVDTCPRGIIHLTPADDTVFVACQNHDMAKDARAACTNACIACGRCVKACVADAIHVENYCAIIDQEKCTRCGACAKVCPCGCIRDMTGQNT